MDNAIKETKFTIVGAGWAGVRTALGLVDSIDDTLQKLENLRKLDPASNDIQARLEQISLEGSFALDLARQKETSDLAEIIKIIAGFTVELWDSNPGPFQGISGNFGIRAHSGLHYPNSRATIDNCKDSYKKFAADPRVKDLLVKTEAYYAFTEADFNLNRPKVKLSHFRAICSELGAEPVNFLKGSYSSPNKTIKINQDNLKGLWKIDEPSIKLGKPLRKHIEQLLESRRHRLVCKFHRRLTKFFEDSGRVRLIFQEVGCDTLYEDNCDFFINATSFQGFTPKKIYTWKIITESDNLKTALKYNGFIYVQSLKKDKPNSLYYRYQTGEISEIVFSKPHEINAELDVFNHTVQAALIEKAINNLGGKMPKDASPIFDAKHIYQPSNNFVIRRKKTGRPPVSFIVMDGLNPCMMPICNDDNDPEYDPEYEYYLLTHAAFTNLASCNTPDEAYQTLKSLTEDEQNKLFELTCKDMSRYWPDFASEFEYVRIEKQAVLAKLVSKEEFRSSFVFGEFGEYTKKNKIPIFIHVFPGKVTDDPSGQVMNLYSASAKSSRHHELINHAGILVVKNDVMHIGSREFGQRMTSEEKRVCSGYLDTLQQLREKSLTGRVRSNSISSIDSIVSISTASNISRKDSFDKNPLVNKKHLRSSSCGDAESAYSIFKNILPKNTDIQLPLSGNKI